MDDCLINNINDTVNKNDSLYILGDFTMAHNYETIKEYRDRINCHNLYLIMGNHDSRSQQSYQTLFKNVYDLKTIKIRVENTKKGEGNSYKLCLCHYPMMEWPGSQKGSWCLHGHSHGNLTVPKEKKLLDVGVDVFNYKPASIEEVAHAIQMKIEE